MKRNLLVPVLALAALAIPILASSSWALERTAPARFNQPCRIAQGVRNGTITGREFRYLQRQQQRIHGARHRAWADGRLTAREHQRLLNMRRRANRHIYRAKHNCARNGPCRRAPARRAPYPAPRLRQGGGFFLGAVTQPGWSLGWNVNLD